ncbi:WEB family [Dillenia turbinata]|uniref:WEB family n=1 Tax=Dillenia turbinata TaxID=194707 RepID=A0AAN8UJE1_9MAGN
MVRTIIHSRHGSTGSGSGSPKTEVGEIDTRAPFQSVRAALSLFGPNATTKENSVIKKSKPAAEHVLDKEAQLHLTETELYKLKEQLKNRESTRARALADLKIAKTTMDELNKKLEVILKSKKSALEAAEAAKNQVHKPTGGNEAWKLDLENSRGLYKATAAEIDAAKQELIKIQQDFNAALEAKLAALQQAEEAQEAATVNRQRVSEISKELSAMKDSLGQVKLARQQSQNEHNKILAERDDRLKSHKAAMEEAENNLVSLKKELDPELAYTLKVNLAETTAEIARLQEEIKNNHASDLATMKSVTSELDEARKALQEAAEQESLLKGVTESLQKEVENMKKERQEIGETKEIMESIAGTLNDRVHNCEVQLEAALALETKEEMSSTLEEVAAEYEDAIKEAEEMKKNIEVLKQEAVDANNSAKETEARLQVALKEAEEAKLAEAKALDQLKELKAEEEAARAAFSESSGKIRISREEFESLKHKVKEANNLADMKVSAAKAKVEAVHASENEAIKKLETCLEELNDLDAATDDALKKAEMAEAAKRMVEAELRKWRQEEEHKAGLSQILQI